MDLFQQSIDIVLNNQHESGAYIASPAFPTYAYSWFRDGSFIAYAMDRVGQFDSSRRFHLWCAKVIERQADKIDTLVDRKERGDDINPSECLTARYSLEGYPTRDEWTDFQLDGYGTWLWALNEHHRRSGDDSLLADITPAIESILQYLITFWHVPCYDCWEEHLDAIHPYTLAAIHAGLEAAEKLNLAGTQRLRISETTEVIRTYLKEETIHPDGYYRKLLFPHGTRGDSELANLVDSLIGLAVPYRIQPVGQENIRATMRKIEDDLYYPNGGVYRYLKDTYYGGGEWVLLAAWLGWYWCQTGQYEKAAQVKSFIQKQADGNGNLPEQVADHLLAPSYHPEWINRWGESANPLLWSQAMYIILCDELKDYEGTH
jgi:GH15 family glucan-1,4-alpha-glucosidase